MGMSRPSFFNVALVILCANLIAITLTLYSVLEQNKNILSLLKTSFDNEQQSITLSVPTQKLNSSLKSHSTSSVDEPMPSQSTNLGLGPSQKAQRKANHVSTDISKPNWNCDIYYCKEGDPAIYPLKTALASKLSELTSFTLTSSIDSNSYVMAVVFDPTCPKCKRYYRETLKHVLNSQGSIRIIPTLYNDKITKFGLQKVQDMLCSNDINATIEAIATDKSTYRDFNCKITIDDARKVIEETKEALMPFNISGIAPITLTKKSTWLGVQPLDVVIKHLE